MDDRGGHPGVGVDSKGGTVGSRGTRRPVPGTIGIFIDKYGYDVRAPKVNGLQAAPKRFDFETPIPEMQLWQAERKADTLKAVLAGKDAAPGPETRGTLLVEAPRYLARIEGKKKYKSDRSHLRAWIGRLATWPVLRITTEQIDLEIAAWEKADVAPQTIIHRLRVLRELFDTLFPSAKNPVHGCKRPGKPKSNPTDVPAELITDVDAKLLKQNDPVSYAIWRVLVTTGQRAGQLNAALPKDVSLTKHTWRVRDAKGEPAHTIYLNADMLAAWRLFFAAAAWGKVDTSKQADKLHAAGWPRDIRPYNARHAVAFAAMENGADISDVAALLGHTDISTTQRTYFSHQPKRMQRVSKELEGRFK